MTQKMADLPANRIQPDDLPFSRTGMDYTGPFDIKQGRVTRKRYGVIFTCMVTRAVHLNRSRHHFVHYALRRFIASRGQVRKITSSNGTKPVGTNQDIKKSIQQLDEHTIEKFTSSSEIQ